ncbi:hypothetical protein GBB84_21210 [Citrobacter sp. NMI7905_11]|uniref:Uncharacterized protein n=1 Tax=Citrobacter telavivensis TaxID=2653932 RepID=A0A6L5ED69_9ENTR|nr:hypothetical protein [Citrobacter telavivensis]
MRGWSERGECAARGEGFCRSHVIARPDKRSVIRQNATGRMTTNRLIRPGNGLFHTYVILLLFRDKTAENPSFHLPPGLWSEGFLNNWSNKMITK